MSKCVFLRDAGIYATGLFAIAWPIHFKRPQRLDSNTPCLLLESTPHIAVVGLLARATGGSSEGFGYVCFLISGLEGLPHLQVYQDHRVGLLHSARTAYRLSDTIFDIHRGGRWS